MAKRTRSKAFTLVELLNVIAIIAILSALFLPVIKAAKGAAMRYNATLTMKNLGGAVSMYMADHDDTYPIAMSQDGSGFRAWFGRMRWDGTFDTADGILSASIGGKMGRDMTHNALPYLGDLSGFGYNWGYLGSDISISGDYSNWPNCYRPARDSELEKSTVLFATSSYYFAPWVPGGDGAKYDFGFVDPPKFWFGNPNVDFRHGDPPEIDQAGHKVTPKGMALFIFTGGSIKTKAPEQVTDEMFERTEKKSNP